MNKIEFYTLIKAMLQAGASVIVEYCGVPFFVQSITTTHIKFCDGESDWEVTIENCIQEKAAIYTKLKTN